MVNTKIDKPLILYFYKTTFNDFYFYSKHFYNRKTLNF
jgi:hypothetical protein